MPGTQPLIDELEAARSDLFAALDAVDPGSLTTPGLIGEWSGRELVAHLGYWPAMPSRSSTPSRRVAPRRSVPGSRPWTR